MHFWLSCFALESQDWTLVDCITWIASLWGPVWLLGGPGRRWSSGKREVLGITSLPHCHALGSILRLMSVGFHSFTDTVLALSCPSSPWGANSSLLLPVFGAPGFSSVALSLSLSFQQSFYKIFLFLFWTVCGELGFLDEYHCLTGMLLYGW